MMQKAQAKVYILVGRVSSGKTTYAIEKEENESAIYLSMDELQLSVFGPDITREDLDRTFEGCKEYQKKLAVKLLKRNIDIYFDWGFWSQDSRESIKEYFKGLGFEVEQIFFDIPLEERLRRNKKRNSGNDGNSFKIKEKDLFLFDSFFEEPSPEENTLVIQAVSHLPTYM